MSNDTKLWDVWQRSVIVCANCIESQADNKIENELRGGIVMTKKPARKVEPAPWIMVLTEEEDD